MRDLEGSLEAALTPSSGAAGGRAQALLASFDDEVSAYVTKYMEQLLEEASPERAAELRLIDREIVERETGLKATREEAERERRLQDTMLKDARHFQQQAEASAKATNGGGKAAPRSTNQGGGLSSSATKR